MQQNIYYRRPYTLKHEETSFHKRDPKTNIICGAEPFFIKGTNTEEAYLCIHGYTSSPRDLRSLAVEINKSGYTVRGPLLPGHGTVPTAMDSVTWQDWYNKVLDEYTKLKKDYKTVNVIGFSMGGALTLHLAANVELGKIILLSPFLGLAYNPYHIVPEEWLVYTVGRFLSHLKKYYSGSCFNVEARKKHISYYHYSLSSIDQALELVSVIKKEISGIKNNSLIIHSKFDATTSFNSSIKLYKELNSKFKRFVKLEKSNHIITMDYDKEKVFREVLLFVNK